MANARPGGWNDSIIAQFRAHGGQMTSGPFTGRTLLLLTTKGAKTSVERTSPLVYSRDGERFVIVASKGGAPTHPAWYHNLRAHPEVTLEVGKEKFRAAQAWPPPPSGAASTTNTPSGCPRSGTTRRRRLARSRWSCSSASSSLRGWPESNRRRPP